MKLRKEHKINEYERIALVCKQFNVIAIVILLLSGQKAPFC
jgi:hypothetical protein